MKIDIDLPEALKASLERIEMRLENGHPCPEYLTVWQFAEMTRRTPRTVQRWVASGKIVATDHKYGRVIHRDQLNQV